MGPTLILCEGEEDAAILNAILAERAIGPVEFHKEFGGVTRFRKSLEGLIPKPKILETKAVIIVADNDAEPAKFFKAVQDEIKFAGLSAPSNPRERAEQDGFPPIYVLMVPWDNEAGCLETICLMSAGNNHPNIMECVDALAVCVGANRWDVPKLAKLRMRCYLSAVCESDPNTTLRWALKKPENPLSAGDVCFDQISEYLASVIY
jgi:hypothetical protein